MMPVQIDMEEWLAAQSAPAPAGVQLRRVDPARNMARFYRLAVERDLFGMTCLIREWGRIGRSGQVRMTAYPSAAEARAALEKQRHAKERRGYLRDRERRLTASPAIMSR